MSEIDINKPKREELAEEITQFMAELNEIMLTASQLNVQGRIRFDPTLFMIWRNGKNN